MAKIYIFESEQSPRPEYEAVIYAAQSSVSSAIIGMKLAGKEKRIELVGSAKLHELYQCHGGSVNGTIKIKPSGQSYDFASSVCGPAYIEMGIKRTEEDKMYIAKLGMKNPAAIKVAVDLVYNSTKAITTKSLHKLTSTMNLYGKHIYLPKERVLLVGAKLWAPMVVTLDAKYDSEKMQHYLVSLYALLYQS